MKGALFNQKNSQAGKFFFFNGNCDLCFELVDHPPYFPDMAHYDYQLLPNINKNILTVNQYHKDYVVISADE